MSISGMSVRAQMSASTTADPQTIAMQKMMSRLLEAAPLNFENIKGAEVSRSAQGVFYKADLTKTVFGQAEMKEALATNFFGAMLTDKDNILESNGSTMYVARYKNDGEFSVCDFVTKAFIGLPKYLQMDDAKVEEEQSDTPGAKTYFLTMGGVVMGRMDYSEKAGKAQLVIGMKGK